MHREKFKYPTTPIDLTAVRSPPQPNNTEKEAQQKVAFTLITTFFIQTAKQLSLLLVDVVQFKLLLQRERDDVSDKVTEMSQGRILYKYESLLLKVS